MSLIVRVFVPRLLVNVLKFSVKEKGATNIYEPRPRDAL